jgi:hypothetical protein
MSQIKAWLLALEDANKPSVPTILHKINALSKESDADFDKYEALSLAE